MNDDVIRKLQKFAVNRGLFLLMERHSWTVYDRETGRVVATVYPDSWRVQLNCGNGGKVSTTDAFAALRAVHAANTGELV